MSISSFRVLLSLGSGLLLSACGPSAPERYHIEGEAQGSYYSINYYDHESRDLQTDIDSIFDHFDLIASAWEEHSELNRLNNSPQSESDSLSPTMLDLLEKSLSICEQSQGAFDITIAPLVKAYGFLSSRRQSFSEARLDSLRALVDYRKLSIVDHRLIRSNPAMRLDFNAIAQGYTCDLIAAYLDVQGIENYLVDVGGEVLARGYKAEGKSWIVGIEKPSADALSERMVHHSIPLNNAAIVTSGTYRKYYESEGKRYSHSIDPSTGHPVQHSLLSISVVDSFAWRADALSTALLVMGPTKSLAFAKAMPSISIYGIYYDSISDGLQVFSQGPAFQGKAH